MKKTARKTSPKTIRKTAHAPPLDYRRIWLYLVLVIFLIITVLYLVDKNTNQTLTSSAAPSTVSSTLVNKCLELPKDSSLFKTFIHIVPWDKSSIQLVQRSFSSTSCPEGRVFVGDVRESFLSFSQYMCCVDKNAAAKKANNYCEWRLGTDYKNFSKSANYSGFPCQTGPSAKYSIKSPIVTDHCYVVDGVKFSRKGDCYFAPK